MTPAQQSQQLLAVHASWAKTSNRTARTEAARAAADRRIAEEYGIPDDLLPEEYGRRIRSARASHFRKLALRSVASRRKARGGDAA